MSELPAPVDPLGEAPSAPAQASLRQKIRSVLLADSRPASLALAIALGIFLGCSPFYGLQTILVFTLAAAFRLNPFAAFLGSQVSFPPLGVGIAAAEVALGEWLRYGRWAFPHGRSGAELAHWLWGHALLSWCLGSALLGGALAALGGLASYGLLVALRSARARGRR
ncbi:MAG: DUF2062 domain-containing protein [Deltaproteobacteria bacterium]